MQISIIFYNIKISKYKITFGKEFFWLEIDMKESLRIPFIINKMEKMRFSVLILFLKWKKRGVKNSKHSAGYDTYFDVIIYNFTTHFFFFHQSSIVRTMYISHELLKY